MDENKVFDQYFELPDGYEVQLMVLRDYPGGRARRGAMSIFRSRVWIGHVSESDPLLHRSQEQPELNVAIGSCYSMALQGAAHVIESPAALEALSQRVHAYFHGIEQVS